MSERQEIKLVALAHFPNSVEAGMASELLENNGISVVLQGANFSGLEPLLIPGGYSEVGLLVAESDSERARQLYSAFFGRQAGEALTDDVEVPRELEESND